MKKEEKNKSIASKIIHEVEEVVEGIAHEVEQRVEMIESFIKGEEKISKDRNNDQKDTK